MTRDAEHTPSPQSVVVPVEPTDEMWAAGERAFDRDPDLHHETVLANIWSAMLAASPAPSSLAGGEVDVERAPNFGFETNEPSLRQVIEFYYRSHGMENWPKLAAQYCAALSPEAPARWGVVFDLPSVDPVRRLKDLAEALALFAKHGGNVVNQRDAAILSDDLFAALSPEAPAREGVAIWEAHTGNDYAVVMLPNENTDTASIQVYSDDETLPQRIADALNALTPRHEAPVDPCKSCNGTGRELGSAFNRCADCEAPAEGAGEAIEQIIYEAFGLGSHSDAAQDAVRRITEYLRARSSAPEAREGEAVACPKCGMFSGDDWKQCGGSCPVPGSPRYTHPAAPSADKLRTAVEALEPFGAEAKDWPPPIVALEDRVIILSPVDGKKLLLRIKWSDFGKASQALASLEAGGA